MATCGGQGMVTNGDLDMECIIGKKLGGFVPLLNIREVISCQSIREEEEREI